MPTCQKPDQRLVSVSQDLRVRDASVFPECAQGEFFIGRHLVNRFCHSADHTPHLFFVLLYVGPERGYAVKGVSEFLAEVAE